MGLTEHMDSFPKQCILFPKDNGRHVALSGLLFCCNWMSSWLGPGAMTEEVSVAAERPGKILQAKQRKRPHGLGPQLILLG